MNGNHRSWWKCEKGHEVAGTILSRTSLGKLLSVCVGKVVIPVSTIWPARYPISRRSGIKQNGTLTPQNVTPYSNRNVWWLCGKGMSSERRLPTAPNWSQIVPTVKIEGSCRL